MSWLFLCSLHNTSSLKKLCILHFLYGPFTLFILIFVKESLSTWYTKSLILTSCCTNFINQKKCQTGGTPSSLGCRLEQNIMQKSTFNLYIKSWSLVLGFNGSLLPTSQTVKPQSSASLFPTHQPNLIHLHPTSKCSIETDPVLV